MLHLRTRWPLLALLAVASTSREALAQSTTPAPKTESRVSAKDVGLPGFDLNAHYIPTPGDRFIGVAEGAVYQPVSTKKEDGWLAHHISQFRIDAIEFAFNPLKLNTTDASGAPQKKDYVAYQFYGARINVALNITNRWMAGGEFAAGGTMAKEDDGAEDKKATTVFGDPRLFTRFNLLGDPASPLAIGLQGDVWLPIGTPNKLTADERIRLLPRLLVSGIQSGFFYAANVGVLFRRHHDFGNAEIGNAITYGAGLGYALKGSEVSREGKRTGHQFGVELYGNTVLPANGSDSPFLGRSSSPAELLFSYRLGSHVASNDAARTGFYVAAGPGLTRAPGVPEWRLLVGFDIAGPYLTEPPPQDRDKDGVLDRDDRCPNEPGTAALLGCPPPPDADKDGVPDKEDHCPSETGPSSAHGCPDADHDRVADKDDACPAEPGPPTSDKATSGCPDADKDGITDKLDACPAEPGRHHEDKALDGCPDRDKDKDGIQDKDDACPDQAGVTSTDPKKNGCPSLASLQGKDIVISEQIRFKTGTAQLDATSEPVLAEVAQILKDHPEIEQLSIEGHTDNVGNKAANKALSKSRADAVKKALEARAVDARRLVAVGLGDTRPLASNDTEEGRLKNRRVEFHATRTASPGAPSAPAPTPRGTAPKKLAPPRLAAATGAQARQQAQRQGPAAAGRRPARGAATRRLRLAPVEPQRLTRRGLARRAAPAGRAALARAPALAPPGASIRPSPGRVTTGASIRTDLAGLPAALAGRASLAARPGRATAACPRGRGLGAHPVVGPRGRGLVVVKPAHTRLAFEGPGRAPGEHDGGAVGHAEEGLFPGRRLRVGRLVDGGAAHPGDGPGGGPLEADLLVAAEVIVGPRVGVSRGVDVDAVFASLGAVAAEGEAARGEVAHGLVAEPVIAPRAGQVGGLVPANARGARGGAGARPREGPGGLRRGAQEVIRPDIRVLVGGLGDVGAGQSGQGPADRPLEAEIAPGAEVVIRPRVGVGGLVDAEARETVDGARAAEGEGAAGEGGARGDTDVIVGPRVGVGGLVPLHTALPRDGPRAGEREDVRALRRQAQEVIRPGLRVILRGLMYPDALHAGDGAVERPLHAQIALAAEVVVAP